MKNLKVVFFGTPDFAKESLAAIHQSNHQVVGVVTVADKPSGRGQKLTESPVKKYAVENNLTVFQPEKLRNPEFLEQIRNLDADVFVVVAFRMMPKILFEMPKIGTFNLHASLLPDYRGAAPINWAVINGDTETGITTFFLKHEIDTGEIIQQVRVPIADTDNVEIVHDKLMYLGGDLVLETVDAILDGSVKPVPQENLIRQETELRPAPKIFKETCRIDWNKGVKQIYDFIRGLSPYPAAWTELCVADGTRQVLKIYETEKVFASHEMNIGDIRTDMKTYFQVAVKDGFINVLILQLAGKKRMNVADFLRGYRTSDNNKVE